MYIKKPWVRFPLCFLDTVSLPAAVLMSILLGIADPENRVFCKQQELADLLRLSVRTVYSLLNELQRAGYILAREQKGYQSILTLAPNLIAPGRYAPAPPPAARSPQGSSFDIAALERFIASQGAGGQDSIRTSRNPGNNMPNGSP